MKILFTRWKTALFTLCLILASMAGQAQTAPTAFNLSNGNYYFKEWASTEPAGTYPANMRFHRRASSVTTDPVIGTALTADYTSAYSATSGARIEGDGSDGISFTNSGNSPNIYGHQAVLALNTSGRTNIQVSWLGRTIVTNPRDYRIRLQYYVGTSLASASWTNANGTLANCEYTPGSAGTSTYMAPITLPAACENQTTNTVYLRWVFYYQGTTTGGRPQLGLDEIAVTSDRSPSITEVILPQYIQGVSGTNSNRVPYFCRLTVSGLTASTTYRVYPQAVLTTDEEAAGGAGNPVFPSTSGNFTTASSPGLSSAGTYTEFTTNGSGSYTGWFGLEPTGSARFANTGSVKIRLIINGGAGGTTQAWHATTTNTVKVQDFSTSAGADNCSAIRGNSSGTAKDFVFLYDNTGATGRPLSGSVIESDGFTVTAANYANFYDADVDGSAGRWGTIIPNSNANGVRAIVNYSNSTGNTLCTYTDADGTWPSGTSTANPTGGTTAVVIASSDAILSCSSCTPPTGQATAAGTNTVTTTSMNVTWTRAVSSPGDNVIVLAKAGTISTDPSNGNAYTASASFTSGSSSSIDGAKVVYIGTGTSVSVADLSPGTNYTFKVYEFANTGNCYNVTSPATTSNTTVSVGTASVVANASNESNTIPSTTTITTITDNTEGVKVWEVALKDGDGMNNDNDFLPTIYTSFTFSQGTGNTVTSWSNTLQDVKFFLNANTTPIAGVVTINATTIVFTPTTPISVAHGAGSSATLHIRASLKTTSGVHTEGNRYVFQLTNANTTVASAATSSQLGAFSISSDNTKNTIAVTATKLYFQTVPANVVTNSAFTVIVQATDANNNVDVDASGASYQVTLAKASGPGALSGTVTSQNLTSGSKSFTDLAVDADGTYTVVTTNNFAVSNATSSNIVASSVPYLLFDNFNRTGTFPIATVGVPSSQSSVSWTEYSSSTTTIEVDEIGSDKLLTLWNCDGGTGPTCYSGQRQRLSYDMSALYSTVFDNAPSELEWRVAMKQNRSAPSGFDAGNYGMAFVLGCDEADFTSATADGYAVVLGESGTGDVIKLVHFSNGMTANSNLTDIVRSTTTGGMQDIHSVRVVYNPCSDTWYLQVRDNNTTWRDPADTVTSGFGTYGHPVYGVNTTHVAKDLKHMGFLFNHQNSTGEYAYFDDVYRPTGATTVTTYLWDGSVSSDWTVADNWTPSRSCVRPSDVLEFKSSSSLAPTNLPSTMSIAQLNIRDSTNLTLAGATGGTTITLNGTSGDDLYVSENSSFRIVSNQPVVINLPTGTTARIRGTMEFTQASSSSTDDHEILGTDASSIIFESGSVFTQGDIETNAFGSTGTQNTAVFRNGSTFIFNGGSNPFALTAPSSKVTFEEGSLYSHRSTSAASFSGRTYSDFEYNNAGNMSVTSGGANAANIRNFTVAGAGNITFAQTLSGAPLQVNISGNLNFAAAGGLIVNPGATRTFRLNFNGTSDQEISGVGAGTLSNSSTPTGNGKITVNKASGVLTVSKDITISDTLELTSGIVVANNAIVTLDGAANGASSTSYIRTTGTGRVARNMANSSPFTFPTGINPLHPLTVEFTSGGPSVISISALAGLTGTDGATPVIEHVVTNYWQLTSSATVSGVVATGQWAAGSEGSSLDRTDVHLMYRQGTNGDWLSSRDAVAASGVDPFAVASGTKNGFGSFTAGQTYQIGIADHTPVAALPVQWLGFNANWAGNGVARLEWATATELNNSGFMVQRSYNALTWENIGFVNGKGTTLAMSNYSYHDQTVNANAGQVYYRLVQTDYSGAKEYSKIARLTTAAAGTAMNVQIAPNPVQNQRLNFRIENVKAGEQLQYSIRQMNGSTLLAQTTVVESSSQWFTVDVATLKPGMYIAQFNTADGVVTRNFVVQ